MKTKSKMRTAPTSKKAAATGLCPRCQTAIQIAPGIGPYCPNEACPVADGLDGRPPVALKAPDSLVQQLGAALEEAMEWNWLDDSADQDIPAEVWAKCNNALKAARDAGLFKPTKS